MTRMSVECWFAVHNGEDDPNYTPVQRSGQKGGQAASSGKAKGSKGGGKGKGAKSIGKGNYYMTGFSKDNAIQMDFTPIIYGMESGKNAMDHWKAKEKRSAAAAGFQKKDSLTFPKKDFQNKIQHKESRKRRHTQNSSNISDDYMQHHEWRFRNHKEFHPPVWASLFEPGSLQVTHLFDVVYDDLYDVHW